MATEALASQVLLNESIIGLAVDGVNFDYSVGQFEAEDSTRIEIIVVSKGASLFLVCVPGNCWDKKAKNRKLPTGFIQKPVSFSVAGTVDVDRADPAEELSVVVWFGWLASQFVEHIQFEAVEASDFRFIDKDSELPCLPHADALLAVAREKFGLQLQGSEVERPHLPNGAEDGSRISSLEKRFSRVEAGLNELLGLQRGGSGFATAREDASGLDQATSSALPKASSKKQAKSRNVPDDKAAFPGLDPSSVAMALAAGVPAEHLNIMSQAVQQKPGALGDAPGSHSTYRKKVDPIHVSDEEEEDAQEEPPENVDPMTAAVLKLTKIVSNLSKPKSGDMLEDSMDFGSSASGLVESGGGVSRKHAAVIRALKRTMKEDPRKLWKIMERNMMEDFALSSSLPNTAAASFTIRGWAEHRSKIQGYPRTVRSVWGIAGVADCLRNGSYDEALCRCLLLMAQYEQESLDRGSFLLAQEFSLEPPAPVSTFAGHQIPDVTEMAYTRVLDQRWIEAFASRLKDVDHYIDMRRKLGQRSPPPASTTNPAPKAKGKGNGKTGAKAAKGNKKGEAEPAAEE